MVKSFVEMRENFIKLVSLYGRFTLYLVSFDKPSWLKNLIRWSDIFKLLDDNILLMVMFFAWFSARSVKLEYVANVTFSFYTSIFESNSSSDDSSASDSESESSLKTIRFPWFYSSGTILIFSRSISGNYFL